MYTPTQSRLEPVYIKASQARSLCRILNKAGRPCDFTTMTSEGFAQPCFLNVTAAEVVAAAHYIPSLAGLPWLKIVQAEGPTDTYFTSYLLRWSE